MWPIRLSELSVREEADRCKSCSVEALLERDDGSTEYVLLLKRIRALWRSLRSWLSASARMSEIENQWRSEGGQGGTDVPGRRA